MSHNTKRLRVWGLWAALMLGGAPCALHAAPALAHEASEDDAAVGRDVWFSRLQWPTEDCPVVSPIPSKSGVEVLRIDNTRSWVRVRCERWAYQGTEMLYLRLGGKHTLLRFPQPDSRGKKALKRDASPLLVGSTILDVQRLTVAVLNKSRGIGDCGQYAVYAADTARPRLLSLRVRECGELPATPIPPEQWPLKRLHRRRSTGAVPGVRDGA